ncbi:MAG: DNA replication/repair protein RecF, partial [Firmicutes bacterium HGW-Firmicutes-13]
MHLKKIVLNNFRNYCRAEVIFDPDLNIFIGDNAQGKTNLLEAIYYLAGGRSYRTNQEKEIIHWDQDSFILSAFFETIKGSYKLQVVNYLNGKKKVKINGIDYNNIKDYFKAVIFSPDDLNLVKGAPSQRRDFLDIEINQIFPLYSYNLQNFYKILRHRNKLLKLRVDNKKTEQSLQVWNEQLVKYGSFILKKRLEVINYLSGPANFIHRRLTDNRENLFLLYSSGLDLKIDHTIEEIKDIYTEELEKKREEEIRYGLTLLGPHRDDLKIFINNQLTRKYASQGQQRTCVLSLKLSVMELIKE